MIRRKGRNSLHHHVHIGCETQHPGQGYLESKAAGTQSWLPFHLSVLTFKILSLMCPMFQSPSLSALRYPFHCHKSRLLRPSRVFRNSVLLTHHNSKPRFCWRNSRAV
ncbi:uncharacterized protein LOC111864063 isoform X2 [Cryptotermes secundus]|uniref:uncharacterized protein LOC111864063 isoform X2 n=1 Tax=Cryptotermes secundus TaxID=105785 RepID=UPI000CD7D38A|nr:uncharacterized protein LOC111864063 isoform X2 [Cryptotermes secundus]